MPPTDQPDEQRLLEELGRSVSEWEDSPYYLRDEEIFDLESFLDDRGASDLKARLEKTYGTPLNLKFWSSNLTYHRLKRAREEVKAQEDQQDERKQEYQEAVERQRKAQQEWLKQWIHERRRGLMTVIPGGKKEKE